MPAPPKDHDAVSLAASLPGSPRAAAEQARVYRNRLRQRPRDRWLRILALAGSLLVHLLVLLGIILGPAYEPLPPQQDDSAQPALQVRLIDTPEPPPPPQGAPARRSAAPSASRAHALALRSATHRPPSHPMVAVPLPAMPAPSIERPRLAPPVIERTAKVKPVAAPPVPASLPKPAPVPKLAPVPVAAMPPPTVVIQTPPASRPVPPKFQPEPVRRPQMEGNQPMPPPPSLVVSPPPAQALPQVAAPSVAMPRPTPQAITAVPADTAPTDAAAAPEAPAIADVPLPAQQQPVVQLQASPTPPLPEAPTLRLQVQVAASEATASELAPVPLTAAADARVAPLPTTSLEVSGARPRSQPLTETVAATTTPASDGHAADEPAASTDTSAVPQPADAGAASSGGDIAPAAAGVAASGSNSITNSEAMASNAAAAGAAGRGEGRDEGSRGVAGARAADGQGMGKQPGRQGGQGHTSAGQGQGEQAQPTVLGSYVQVMPHGDTQIMQHKLPPIGYKATRFDKDWTPLHESSVDTAVRRLAEKATVKHSFHLPGGVTVDCVLSPLGWMISLTCAPPPQQTGPVDPGLYARLDLAPANPVVPPAPVAAAEAVAAAVPPGNSAECATARVSGGPVPPDCPVTQVKVVAPVASGSWVPASDQFH